MILSATIIGRTHRIMQQNCQDFAVGNVIDSDAAFGLVLDGCGSKYRDATGTYPANNEVGANLLGSFAAAFLSKQKTKNGKQKTENEEFVLDDIVARLYRACVTYLDCLIMLHPFQDDFERRRFVATRLLCTLVGFVMTEETAVCFWSGDGYLGINDEIISLDSNNHPDYLAYQVLDGGKYGESNGRFNTLTIRDRNNLNRLIVATDGWQATQLQQLVQPQNSLSLQRWMNTQARERGNFEDDGAIAFYFHE
ncbi:MAG: hypothetical protein DWQ04_19140 [Chloroflexi bacterium]|nr:MAG: hypothetical protein DWQ04_19140 [Chloroflexota bacterium]